jgi:hypothetical protein
MTAPLPLRKQLAIGVLLACFSLAVRAPFLMRSEAFFDSDEAVEGLMARHVLRGELPTFYWGQSYKGVPETYLAAAAFAMFGSHVAVLKGLTAVLFALYIAASFMLVGRWFGWRIAIASSLMTAVGPPALMYWTLSANAEFVLVMLFGTVLLLLAPALIAKPSGGGRVAFGLVAGLGAWTHPLIACYLLPLGLLGLLGSAWWRANRSVKLVRAVIVGRTDGRPRPLVLLFNAAALLYAGLGAAAFVAGGIDQSLFGVPITVHNPQKMAAVAVLCGLLTLATVAHTEFSGPMARLWREALPCLTGFLVGYVPVLLHALRGGRVGAPLRAMDLERLWRAVPAMLDDIPTILAGFAGPTTDRLPLPIALVAPAVFALGLCLWDSRGYLWDTLTLRARGWSLGDGFFPVFLVILAAAFVVSGMCLDAYSYRYLVPAYAALPVALAIGCRSAGRWTRWLPGALFLAMLAMFSVQELLWFRTLTPDPCDRRVVACLKALGVRGGRADYWISYRLTFLSDEEIIIAPDNGVDRYPPYSEEVASLDRTAHLRRVGGEPPGSGATQCRCGDVEASVSDNPNSLER